SGWQGHVLVAMRRCRVVGRWRSGPRGRGPATQALLSSGVEPESLRSRVDIGANSPDFHGECLRPEGIHAVATITDEGVSPRGGVGGGIPCVRFLRIAPVRG